MAMLNKYGLKYESYLEPSGALPDKKNPHAKPSSNSSKVGNCPSATISTSTTHTPAAKGSSGRNSWMIPISFCLTQSITATCAFAVPDLVLQGSEHFQIGFSVGGTCHCRLLFETRQ